MILDCFSSSFNLAYYHLVLRGNYNAKKVLYLFQFNLPSPPLAGAQVLFQGSDIRKPFARWNYGGCSLFYLQPR